jgi:DNA-binding MarR family transcriptional regulator
MEAQNPKSTKTATEIVVEFLNQFVGDWTLPKVIAYRTGVPYSTVLWVLKKLEKKGLIRIDKHPAGYTIHIDKPISLEDL